MTRALPWFCLLLLPVLLCATAAEAEAARRGARRGARRSPTDRPVRGPVEVPVDLGLGPAVHWITGPVADDQTLHYGMKISVAAIIDAAMIRRYKHKIPKKFRKLASKADEVRYKPSIFIPDTLHISPKLNETGIYGVTWRPISVGVPLLKKPVRFTAGVGVLLTYLFVHSDSLAAEYTHFLRPGLDLQAEIELPLSKSFLVSFGWASQFYPPQRIGESPADFATTRESIWHIGQGFMKFHFRFPYEVKL